MATNSLDKFGLSDVAMLTDPKGNTPKITNILEKKSNMARNGFWMEANSKTMHESVQRASKIKGYDRQYYKGNPPSVTKFNKQFDKIGTIEDSFVVDYKLAELAGDKTTYINQQIINFTADFAEILDSRLIYSNGIAEPDRPTGLMPRLNHKDVPTVIDHGGLVADDGEMTSIYAITHGTDMCAFLYPEGSKAGLDQKVWSLSRNNPDGLGAGNQFLGYPVDFLQDYGMVAFRPRSIGRICNIAPDDKLDASKIRALVNQMEINSNTRFYINRSVRGKLWDAVADSTQIQFIANKAGENERGLDVGGMVNRFMDIPFQFNEMILDTEKYVEFPT